MVDVTAQSWKLSLACTKAEAEMIAEAVDPLPSLDPPPVLMTSEEDESAGAWRLDAYFEGKPDDASIAAVHALLPTSGGRTGRLEALPDEDWVTLSQANLEPITTERFFVHTAAHAAEAPANNTIALHIEAGQAFGTGQHHTTTGCLLMLERMKRDGLRFSAIADVGTGTGLLAFAAYHLWPQAHVIASDIDPIATRVAEENAALNAIALGPNRGAVELVTAAGLAHRRLRSNAPYDLIIANILAGPLIELAPVFASALRPGASLILAGLLGDQADRVAQAYRRQYLRLADRIDRAEWPTLRLVKRRPATRHDPKSDF